MDARCGKTLRVAFGNGMRPEVWVPFQKKVRFGEERRTAGAKRQQKYYTALLHN